MARQRSPDRLKAEEIYLEHKGNIDLVDIADKLGRPKGTVRGWKNKDEWDEKLNGTFQKKSDKDTERSNKKKNTKKYKKDKIKDSNRQEVEEVFESENLTDKQKLFCIYFTEHFNATKAYQQAYDCDRETARRCGSRLLTNVDVKSEVDRLTEECLKEEGINSKLIAKRTFQKYIDIAFSDISDFMEFGQEEVVVRNDYGEPLLDSEGNEVTFLRNYVNFKNSNEVDGTIVTEVSKGKNGVKVKLADKMRALDFLAEHIGLLSQIDKAKIESEKSKAEKIQIEIDNMAGDKEGEEVKDWVSAIEEIAAKRSGKDE